MKILAALILCLLASTARGQTFDQRIDDLQRDNLAVRDQLVAAQVELRAAKDAVAVARTENIDQNAAFKGTLDAKNAFIKKQAKTLDSPWVKAALFVRRTLYWIAGIGSLFYVLALVGAVCSPHTAMFKLSGKLISLLPFANIVESIAELFRKTMTVDAKEVPIVAPPAVVTASPDPSNAEIAQRLASMPPAEPTFVAPPAPAAPSAMAQAFYGYRDTSTNLGQAFRK